LINWSIDMDQAYFASFTSLCVCGTAAPGVELGLKEVSHDQDRHYFRQRIEDRGTG